MANNSLIEDRVFASGSNSQEIKIPYVLSPDVEVVENSRLPILKENSEKELAAHYAALSKSGLNRGGSAIIFGTFDNLHVGHQIMLKTAAALCKSLYVGIEEKNAALMRKNFRHPILDNEERIKDVQSFSVTTPEKIFIRQDALQEIIKLEKSGTPLSTVFVGATQNDNNEIISAVEYCQKKGIQVVAITRAKVLNGPQISSSLLHKEGLAKTNRKPSP